MCMNKEIYNVIVDMFILVEWSWIYLNFVIRRIRYWIKCELLRGVLMVLRLEWFDDI